MQSTAETVGNVSLRAIAMLKGFDKDVWAAVVTLSGKPQINKPGWEITEMWDDMFQAVAISSRYRFCGQGNTPRAALDEAYTQMREFSVELKNHMEQT
jgi:hypothetical protein